MTVACAAHLPAVLNHLHVDGLQRLSDPAHVLRLPWCRWVAEASDVVGSVIVRRHPVASSSLALELEDVADVLVARLQDGGAAGREERGVHIVSELALSCRDAAVHGAHVIWCIRNDAPQVMQARCGLPFPLLASAIVVTMRSAL